MSRKLARTHAPRLERGQRVNEILTMARDVFCERGYENAAVSEIAARLGVVEGTIYKYFDTKRELLLKVLERWYDEMFGDYARDLAGITGTRQRLRFLIWRHLRTVKVSPLLCRLMFREFRAGQDYPGSHLHDMNRRYTQFLIEMIQEGVRAGEFRSDLSLLLLRDMVYGGIEHHTWNYICGRGDLDIDAIAEQITTVLCEGIAVPAERPLSAEVRRLSQRVARMERSGIRGDHGGKLARPKS